MTFKLALVTGATSGIGFALCEVLAQQGIDLIATGRSADRLADLKKQVGDQILLKGIVADLSLEADRKRLIEAIHQYTPDLIINNAGFGLYGEALTYLTAEQLAMVEVNCQAVLEITLESARALTSSKQSGIIINVSSAAAFQIFPSFAIYSATKAFVNHFSQSLDYELRPYGIRVLVACPGMVQTDFQMHAGAEKPSDNATTTMSPSEVAHLIWKQIQNQNPLMLMNWKYRFLTALTKILPKSWLASRLNQTIQARIKPRKIIKIKR